MSQSKPLIEKEDSKMKSYIKNLKPKKLNIFKRMKRSVTNFFDKCKSNKNNSYKYHELMNEETESFDYEDYDLKTKLSLPWPYMVFWEEKILHVKEMMIIAKKKFTQQLTIR